MHACTYFTSTQPDDKVSRLPTLHVLSAAGHKPICHRTLEWVQASLQTLRLKASMCPPAVCLHRSDRSADLKTNFVSDKPSSWYAELYKRDHLTGGHVIMLGSDAASRYKTVKLCSMDASYFGSLVRQVVHKLYLYLICCQQCRVRYSFVFWTASTKYNLYALRTVAGLGSIAVLAASCTV